MISAREGYVTDKVFCCKMYVGFIIATCSNAVPAFWGKYFTSIETTGNVEYRHTQENPVLAQANICLLPIARQTPRVSGSSADGSADAASNESTPEHPMQQKR